MSTLPKVLLMHSILEPGPALLAEGCETVPFPSNQPLDEEHIKQAVESNQAVGILSQVMDPIGATVLSASGLKIVAQVAVGYDNVDLKAATENHVMVTNTPGILDETTADFAFTLMMSVARRVVVADNFVRGGNFKGWEIDMMLGQDVQHATLGIVGIGRIGRAVARRAKGFNMRVLYSDPNPLLPDVEREMGVARADLSTLLSESDFISLHVPLTDSTQHLISTKEFELMKPTAILVNTSRGPVLDESALVEALKSHRIFGAGLDVYEREPAIHPGLLALRNVVLAPHIASASTRTRAEMCAVAVRNLLTGLRGGRPANLLNTEVTAK